MPALRDREFKLPGRTRAPWWLWTIAAAVHVVLLVLLIRSRTHHAVASLTTLAITAVGDSNRAVPLPRVRGPVLPRASTPVRPSPDPPLNLAMVGGPSLPPASTTLAIVPAPVDSPPRGGTPGIRPRYGDGRLWVEPLPESPRQIASALTGKSPAELADSAVAQLIQKYLDEMARERAENPPGLPSWTTKLGGKTVGLDQKWIYLGPLKIPTALLALLPIKLQGNMSNYQFNQQLQLMREDLFEAARRAGNYEEFKEAVKDLHQQKEREREFKRNQRTKPDSGRHG